MDAVTACLHGKPCLEFVFESVFESVLVYVTNLVLSLCLFMLPTLSSESVFESVFVYVATLVVHLALSLCLLFIYILIPVVSFWMCAGLLDAARLMSVAYRTVSWHVVWC